VTHVADPMQQVFGMSARELFRQPALHVSEGAFERFPEFMRQGSLESIDALCRDYAGTVEVANGSSTDGVQFGLSGAHPTALLAAGLTVYFSDLKRLLPRSQPWLRDLEAALGVPECASIMAFANAPGSGLTLHHDRHDQLFFQLCGEKSFRYAKNTFVQNPDVQFSPANAAHPDFGARYRKGFPRTTGEVLQQPFETLNLRPGSAFFMPAGTWHTTAEQSSHSLSLVVAVRAPSQLSLLLNLLQYYVGQAPEWRARSYGGWDSDATVAAAAHESWAPLVADLARRLGGLSAADAHRAWSADGFMLGNFTQYPAGAGFERFIRLPNSSLAFDGEVEGKLRCVVLSGPNHRPQARTVLGINAEARGVIEWILASHAAFTVSELCAHFPDFERDEVEALFGWLGGAGLIRPLPGPEWEP
jgi:hypothetical protein